MLHSASSSKYSLYLVAKRSSAANAAGGLVGSRSLGPIRVDLTSLIGANPERVGCAELDPAPSGRSGACACRICGGMSGAGVYAWHRATHGVEDLSQDFSSVPECLAE